MFSECQKSLKTTYTKGDITMNEMAVVSVNKNDNNEAKDQTREQNHYHNVINFTDEDIKNFPGLMIPNIYDNAGISDKDDMKMDIDDDNGLSFSRSWSIVRIMKE